MTKKSLVIFIGVVLFSGSVIFANPQTTGSPSFCYLGVLAKGYPESLLRSQLGMAQVSVYSIEEDMILFSIGQNTKITGFFNQSLPFLKGVYMDRQGVLKNSDVAKTKIAKKFMALLSGRKHLENITTGMRTIDEMIRKRAVPVVPHIPALLPDDGFEENDTFETAAAVTPGTYSDLQCLDDDWYKVTVSAGQDLVVTINFDDTLGDIDMELYDGSSNYIMGSYGVQDLERVYGAKLAEGTYYIYVYGYSGATNPYSMTVATGNLVGGISGQVTDSAIAPLEDVEVSIYDTNWHYLDYAYTDADGNYSIDVLPVTAYVSFWGLSAGNYVEEYYNNRRVYEDPDEVTVTAGIIATGIDAALAAGGSITGKVTNASGAGLDDVYIAIYDLSHRWTNGAQTDSSGNYTADGIATGSYKVYFDSYNVRNYLDEWYDKKADFETATQVNVTAGSTTPEINAILSAVRVDFLGTWDGQGVYYRNSETGAWVKLATPATLITAGNLDWDDQDDLIGIWPGQGGVWVKYSDSGSWAKLSSTARDIATGDMNGYGDMEFIATWDGQGVYYLDDYDGWVKLATPADQVTAGDLDGDGQDDLIGVWPGQGGVWVKYSDTGSWAKLSTTARDIATGDMNGDGREDLVATWDGQGVYYRNSVSGAWVKLATPATLVATGEMDGDGKDDLIGIWPGQAGVWVKYSQTGSWAKLSTTARHIAAGLMRGGAGAAEVLTEPFGGFAEGPGNFGYQDLSEAGPGGMRFLCREEKNLMPLEDRESALRRMPGPDEYGFQCFEQENLIPGSGTTKEPEGKEQRKQP